MKKITLLKLILSALSLILIVAAPSAYAAKKVPKTVKIPHVAAATIADIELIAATSSAYVPTPAPSSTATLTSDPTPSTATSSDPLFPPITTAPDPQATSTPTTTLPTEETPAPPVIVRPTPAPIQKQAATTTVLGITLPTFSFPSASVGGGIYASKRLSTQQTEYLLALAGALGLVGLMFASGNALGRLLVTSKQSRLPRDVQYRA